MVTHRERRTFENATEMYLFVRLHVRKRLSLNLCNFFKHTNLLHNVRVQYGTLSK